MASTTRHDAKRRDSKSKSIVVSCRWSVAVDRRQEITKGEGCLGTTSPLLGNDADCRRCNQAEQRPGPFGRRRVASCGPISISPFRVASEAEREASVMKREGCYERNARIFEINCYHNSFS